MTDTNIKNLPEGPEYFTELGYSQAYPWIVVSNTPKTKTLARVLVEPDPEWKSKIHMVPGGFAAHCTNQAKQTWLYAGFDPDQTVTIRQTKKGWRYKGRRFAWRRASYFYDYNF